MQSLILCKSRRGAYRACEGANVEDRLGQLQGARDTKRATVRGAGSDATPGMVPATAPSARRAWRTLLALGGAALLAGGCASTATGKKQSRFSASPAPAQLQAEAPAGGVLAVVRYPAMVEDDAHELFRARYTTRSIGGAVPRVSDQLVADTLADMTVVKSNYFALSLFKELAAELPPNTVLLSPHAITLDGEGRLSSRPMTGAETLPSVVSVDFAAYSLPNPRRMMGDVPLTFGDLITPLVTVRTDHLASVPTHGLLLASEPLLGVAAFNGRETARDTITAIQTGELSDAVPELDFVSYLNSDPVRSVEVERLSRAHPENHVQSYPVERIRLDEDALNILDEGDNGRTDPLSNPFSAGFADRIVDIINGLDVDRASAVGRASAIARFDPDLGALAFAPAASADQLERLRYAERLLDAQRSYLSVQSLRIFDGIHNGEMGAQVRDMILAERNVLERRRQLARQQNVTMALSLAAILAAGSVGGGGDRAFQSGSERLLSGIVRQAGFYALQEAWNLRRESRGIGENYITAVLPALEEQQLVSVDLIDSNETITAIRYEDLQTKLLDLYQSNLRSLEGAAGRCAYNRSGAGLDGAEGTWLGACEGGLGHGPGVGVLRQADGTAEEFYGTARRGAPDGPGILVRHFPMGSESFEGTFRGGALDGPVRVSRRGQPDSFRRFQGGQDVGPARPENVLSPFEDGFGGGPAVAAVPAPVPAPVPATAAWGASN